MISKNKIWPGVTGPDNDQDQTTTTLRGRCVVLKFQDHTTTSEKCCGRGLVLRHRSVRAILTVVFSPCAQNPGGQQLKTRYCLVPLKIAAAADQEKGALLSPQLCLRKFLAEVICRMGPWGFARIESKLTSRGNSFLLQMVKMMITVVIIYALCWLPLHTITLVGDTHPGFWSFPYIQVRIVRKRINNNALLLVSWTIGKYSHAIHDWEFGRSEGHCVDLSLRQRRFQLQPDFWKCIIGLFSTKLFCSRPLCPFSHSYLKCVIFSGAVDQQPLVGNVQLHVQPDGVLLDELQVPQWISLRSAFPALRHVQRRRARTVRGEARPHVRVHSQDLHL